MSETRLARAQRLAYDARPDVRAARLATESRAERTTRLAIAARHVRAVRLAAEAHQSARVSFKDGLRFGCPRNERRPIIAMTAEEFDAMTDAAVIARLRDGWR